MLVYMHAYKHTKTENPAYKNYNREKKKQNKSTQTTEDGKKGLKVTYLCPFMDKKIEIERHEEECPWPMAQELYSRCLGAFSSLRFTSGRV